MRRARNLSYTPPFLPATASPASMSSILLYPLAVSALVSASHCSGAAPRPKRVAVRGAICRWAR